MSPPHQPGEKVIKTQVEINCTIGLELKEKFAFQVASEIEKAALELLKEKRARRKPGGSLISDAVLELVVSCFLKECRGEKYSLSQLHKTYFPKEKYEMLRTKINYPRDWKKDYLQQ